MAVMVSCCRIMAVDHLIREFDNVAYLEIY